MSGSKSVQVFIHFCDSMWFLGVEENLCRFSFIFVIVCVFMSGSKSVQVFIHFCDSMCLYEWK